MKPGPLGQLAFDLRDRIRTMSPERRAELAYQWARRAIHINLAEALRADRASTSPGLAGWIGSINGPDDARRACVSVERILAELGPFKPREHGDPPLTREDRDRSKSRVLFGWAKHVFESLHEDMTSHDLSALVVAALSLANEAGCFEQEQRDMLADAGGHADG